MRIDPYSELGVSKDAGPEEIKAAHRRAVKRTHPDSGGSEEAFVRVQQSYVILTDQDRRERYDRTGETESDAVRMKDAQLRDALAHVIAQAMDQPIDWTHDDLGDVVRAQLKAVIDQIETKRLANMKAQAKLASIRKRFKPKGAGDAMREALLRDAFEGHQQNLLREEDQMKEALDLNAQVAAVFEVFNYEFDPKPPEPERRSFFYGSREEAFLRDAVARAGGNRTEF